MIQTILFDKSQVELAIKALTASDKQLGRLMKKAGPFQLSVEHMQSPFDSLLESIIYQQLSGKAAATIFRRVKELFPHSVSPTPDDILGIKEELLRSAGVSRSKTLALKDLAAKAKSGIVPSLQETIDLNDRQLVERLVQIHGVGRWTVEMMLIFRLGRPDVLPSTDYGIRKGFALTFETEDLPDAKEIEKHAERWRPFRTIASWYLWRAVDNC